MPLFSIITISYNEKDRIGKTLESVYQQTCQDYEYILVDGLSTRSEERRVGKEC